MAGLATSLTPAAPHLVGIDVTGMAVNPARSIRLAVVVGGEAPADLRVVIAPPSRAGGWRARCMQRA
jgi:aquaporin Z